VPLPQRALVAMAVTLAAFTVQPVGATANKVVDGGWGAYGLGHLS